MDTVDRFFTPPSKSFFLFGPRGTGKSTLMRKLYKDAVWIDLLRPDTLRSYLAHPERLYDIVRAASSKTIVIDEVQKVSNLLPVIHSLIEEKPELQFVLTGSSSRKLKQTGADLLGGRAVRRSLHPFMASELGQKFSLTSALANGLLPLVIAQENPQDTLQAYINLYLQEEIYAEGLVRNLDNFSRFLEVISFSHGSLLNVSNISRECEVKRKTVENYIDILEELLLAFQIPVFTKKAKRELSSQPKFYLFDTGVFRALRPSGPLDRAEEIEGAALEGLVAQHLKGWIDYTKTPHTLSFWRTRSGVEVDFVVYGPEVFTAIEVKNSKRVFSNDTKNLEAFLTDYPMAKGIILYRGDETLQINNVRCVPCEDFLRSIIPQCLF